MKGLHIDDSTEYPRSFAQVFGSVLEAFAQHYWYIDGYGPFSITDKPNFRELDAELDHYSVPVEGLEGGPPGLWRPGLFPWAADLLVVDEGTTLVGISDDQDYATKIATALKNSHQTTAKILELIAENKIDLALIYVAGWWEVYSGNLVLLRRIAQIDGTRETDSEDLLRLLYPQRKRGGSMAIGLSDEVKQLVDRANFAHLATLMSDGSPQSVPVWIGREGERLVVCTGEGSLKAKNTKRDARVAISVVDFHNPYEEVQIRGRVVERRPDADFKMMDAISHKYTGKPFPFRSPEGRVALIIDVGKVRYTKLPFEHTPAGNR